MSLSMYDVSVPVYRQILIGVSGVLDKAETHCAEAGIAPAEWLEARLADDMLPFSRQIMLVVVHSAGALAVLRGQAFERPRDLDSFAGCKAAVTAAIAAVDAATPAELEGVEDKEVAFVTRNGAVPYLGRDFLLSFAMPNFYFHAATAYDILRHKGLAIGKSDFMGPVRRKEG